MVLQALIALVDSSAQVLNAVESGSPALPLVTRLVHEAKVRAKNSRSRVFAAESVCVGTVVVPRVRQVSYAWPTRSTKCPSTSSDVNIT